MPKLFVKDLVTIGFREAGFWELSLDTGELLCRFLGNEDPELESMLCEPQALYAFASGDSTLYIGKSARTVKQRLAGYIRPNISQRTNLRCNVLIRQKLAKEEEVRILVFRATEKIHQQLGRT